MKPEETKEKDPEITKEQTDVNNADVEAETIDTLQEEEINSDAEEQEADAEQEASTEEKQEETDPLTTAQQEAEDWKQKYLYKVAEFDNYRKRTLKEKAELILNGGEKTISAILPVIDDMERALQNQENTDDVAALREGMDLIYKKLIKTLEGMGVKKIDTTDADFSTEFHEAIAMVPGMGDDKKGKVIDCVQTGYTLNDKVIRYAKVAVGQ